MVVWGIVYGLYSRGCKAYAVDARKGVVLTIYVGIENG